MQLSPSRRLMNEKPVWFSPFHSLSCGWVSGWGITILSSAHTGSHPALGQWQSFRLTCFFSLSYPSQEAGSRPKGAGLGESLVFSVTLFCYEIVFTKGQVVGVQVDNHLPFAWSFSVAFANRAAPLSLCRGYSTSFSLSASGSMSTFWTSLTRGSVSAFQASHLYTHIISKTSMYCPWGQDSCLI